MAAAARGTSVSRGGDGDGCVSESAGWHLVPGARRLRDPWGSECPGSRVLSLAKEAKVAAWLRGSWARAESSAEGGGCAGDLGEGGKCCRLGDGEVSVGRKTTLGDLRVRGGGSGRGS